MAGARTQAEPTCGKPRGARRRRGRALFGSWRACDRGCARDRGGYDRRPTHWTTRGRSSIFLVRSSRYEGLEMDVLTDVMQTVRVRSHLYGRLELGAPWGMEFGACDRPGFFIVSRGNCWLEVTGIDGPVPLAGGDFVFLPKGRAHTL